MTLTPQKERKLVEDVQVLTGERGDSLDRAVRVRDLKTINQLSATVRATTGVLRTDLDELTGRVTTAEGTIAVHTAQIAGHEARIDALEAGGGGSAFIMDGDDIEGEGGLLIIDLEAF